MKPMLAIAAIIVVLAGWQLWRKQNAEHLAQLQRQTDKLRHEAGKLQRETEKLQQESETMRRESQTLRQEAARLQDSAAEVNAQSQNLKQQVEDERAFAEQERKRYLRAAQIAEGLQMAAQAKTAITEYYLTQNRWPESGQAVGLSAPDTYKGAALKSMSVASSGVIVLTYGANENVDAGEVRLKPSFDGNQLKWRCETVTYSDIVSIAPACVFTGNRRN